MASRNIPIIENRPFSLKPRYSGSGSSGPRLSMGYIESITNTRVGDAQGTQNTALRAAQYSNRRYRLRFLFNPTTINISYNPDSSLTFPPFESEPARAAVAGLFYPGLRTLSFDLLFDRTYEVYLNPNTNGGVSHDTEVFKGLMGMNNTQFIPLPLPLNFVFGSGPGALRFKGYVTGANISYTHFARTLTPMRMGISLDVNELVSSNLGTAAATGKTS